MEDITGKYKITILDKIRVEVTGEDTDIQKKKLLYLYDDKNKLIKIIYENKDKKVYNIIYCDVQKYEKNKQVKNLLKKKCEPKDFNKIQYNPESFLKYQDLHNYNKILNKIISNLNIKKNEIEKVKEIINFINYFENNFILLNEEFYILLNKDSYIESNKIDKSKKKIKISILKNKKLYFILFEINNEIIHKGLIFLNQYIIKKLDNLKIFSFDITLYLEKAVISNETISSNNITISKFKIFDTANNNNNAKIKYGFYQEGNKIINIFDEKNLKIVENEIEIPYKLNIEKFAAFYKVVYTDEAFEFIDKSFMFKIGKDCVIKNTENYTLLNDENEIITFDTIQIEIEIDKLNEDEFPLILLSSNIERKRIEGRDLSQLVKYINTINNPSFKKEIEELFDIKYSNYKSYISTIYNPYEEPRGVFKMHITDIPFNTNILKITSLPDMYFEFRGKIIPNNDINIKLEIDKSNITLSLYSKKYKFVKLFEIKKEKQTKERVNDFYTNKLIFRVGDQEGVIGNFLEKFIASFSLNQFTSKDIEIIFNYETSNEFPGFNEANTEEYTFNFKNGKLIYNMKDNKGPDIPDTYINFFKIEDEDDKLKIYTDNDDQNLNQSNDISETRPTAYETINIKGYENIFNFIFITIIEKLNKEQINKTGGFYNKKKILNKKTHKKNKHKKKSKKSNISTICKKSNHKKRYKNNKSKKYKKIKKV